MYRLLLLALVFQGVASGTFIINFETNIYVPFQPAFQVPATAGSFDFDPSNLRAPFSNFTVTWNGTIFDMTDAANTTGGPGFGCDSQTVAPRVGINTLFQSFVAPCSNIIYAWGGLTNSTLDLEQFTFFAGNPSCCSYEVYKLYGIAPLSVDVAGQGTYSVSETPEPRAFIELLMGVLALSVSWFDKVRGGPAWRAMKFLQG